MISLPNKMPPLQMRTGVTQDISAWLQFTFWQPVLFLDVENSWPSTKERSGRWVGVAENVGDALTFWIVDDQSKQLLARSVVRPNQHNHRVKWDPQFASKADGKTARHGGGDVVTKDMFQFDLESSDLEDDFDRDETLPEPRPRKINDSVVQDPILKISPATKPKDAPQLDCSLNPFVPAMDKDPYDGPSLLRFTTPRIPLDPQIEQFTRKAQQNYNDIRYKGDYRPEEFKFDAEDESPTHSMKTEPEMDPVPKVKQRTSEDATQEKPRRSKSRPRRTKRKPKPPELFTVNKTSSVWRPVMNSIIILAGLIGATLLPSCTIMEPVCAFKRQCSQLP